MDYEHENEMMRELDGRLAEGGFDGRNVLLFGHCNATETMAGYLISRSVMPAAILDNNPSKQGNCYRNIPILSPGHITKYDKNNSIVLIAIRFYPQMAAQLRQLGYDGEIVQVIEYDTFNEYSLDDDTYRKRIERVKRGGQLLADIRSRYPSQLLVICPHKALGDVYWAMAFLEEYRKNINAGGCVIVVTGAGCLEVVKMFDAGEGIVLSKQDADELMQSVIFLREKNCIIAHHDRLYTDNTVRFINKHFLSFIDYYRTAVYGLPADATPAVPVNIEAFSDVGSIPGGNSVILAPYAKSVVELPDAYWAGIAEDYIKRGYTVFTYVFGSEQPAGNTRGISAPLSQLVSLAERAGTFIGLRSGLCDIIHTAKCRKTAIYRDCYYSTTPFKIDRFFALPGWESITVTDVQNGA